MNEPFPQQEKESPQQSQTQPQTQPQKPGRGLAMLVLLLALTGSAGVAWLWWQNRTADSAAATELAAASAREGQQLAGLESRIASLESSVSSLDSADPGARISTLEKSLDSLQASSNQWQAFRQDTSAWTRSMQVAIEAGEARLKTAESQLAVLSARNRDSAAELDLAEVEYVLRLAGERLNLFADTRTANQALLIASQQLAAFDNPLYLGIQQDIATARLKLTDLSGPDYLRIYASLDALQSAVMALPFKDEADTKKGVLAEGETSWWERIKQSLSGLVTVRRDDEIANSIPVFADQDLIRQHAWLELEIARLAALRRDQLSWTAALNRLAATLAHWFDPASQASRDVLAQLGDLQHQDIDPTMPDISAPLAALQAMRAAGVTGDTAQ